MTLPRAAGPALVAAAVVTVSGCSGGGGNTFAEQANAVCADFDEQIAETPTPTQLADLAGSAERIADLIEQGTDALRELEPPASQAATYEDWLDLNDDAVANAREIAAAAEDGDQARVVELAALAEENEAQADALAEELGLDECLIEEPGR